MTPPQDIPEEKKWTVEAPGSLPQRAGSNASNVTSSGTRTERPVAPERTNRCHRVDVSYDLCLAAHCGDAIAFKQCCGGHGIGLKPGPGRAARQRRHEHASKNGHNGDDTHGLKERESRFAGAAVTVSSW